MKPTKIIFYHELLAEKNLSLRDIFQGKAPVSGGMGRIAIAKQFAKWGHEVHVFHHLNGQGDEGCIENVHSHAIPDEAGFVHFARTLLKGDIVIVNHFDALPQLGKRLLKTPAIKLVWAGCNLPFEWCDLIDQHHFHRMVCVSKTAREAYRFHKNFPFVEYTYTALNSAVPLSAPRKPVPDRVVFLGALYTAKGFHHVLKAWPLVRRLRPSAQLIVLGSIRLHLPDAPLGRTGVLTPEFEKTFLDPVLPASGRWEEMGIQFIYPLSRIDIYNKLSETWVGVVNPNLTGSTETYGQAAVEMQACGCPCIGGGTGGLLETIADGVSGYHLWTQNPEELADQIVQVLSNPTLQQKLREGALRHGRQFVSPEREAGDWLKIIERAKAGSPSPYPPRPLADLIRLLRLSSLKRRTRCLLQQIKERQGKVFSPC